MLPLKTVFQRYEKKYIITAEKRELLLERIESRIKADEYAESTVCSIYFDTRDYRLIRNSIEKPVFKEKLRIRSYGTPTSDSLVFIEIKRKCKGVVYKRREVMTYEKAVDFLCRGKLPDSDSQIIKEIEYMQSFYGLLRPTVSVFYNRTAYFGTDDNELRITFDNNIRFRNSELDLSKGDFGKVILGKDKAVMEIKCIGSMPLWLTEVLNELEIYPATFSKYAVSYMDIMKPSIEKQIAHN